MFLRLVPAVLGLLLTVTPSHAGELKQSPKAVVELFTSQGCSSCPPADALLEELGKRPDVLALAYHVDYWDYIGWEDTFGEAAHADRQRAYAAAWKSPRIFTPQLVVNGTSNVVGSRRDDVAGAISAARLGLAVALEPDGDMLAISVPARAGADEAVVWLVCFRDRAEVTIERGENKGRTIAYTQIVLNRQVLGMWDPATGAELKVPLKEVMPDGANGLAVIVQRENDGLPGPILGAASYTR
jgi:hypothetical protein